MQPVFSPIAQGWEDRQEEDNLLIERILLLVRNILHVPTDAEQEKVKRVLGHLSCAGYRETLLFQAFLSSDKLGRSLRQGGSWALGKPRRSVCPSVPSTDHSADR